ncbi:hypothetical protein DSO57_1016607 [Entomophthora muscae]|uniref:Uncharacterized protein n=1 Tax=Entomophthora muscae TaxID=34485 RepID=A0ACC2SHV7_9FUNG|nr:hypothetical protein DSO57_1016607 [Entomophthora muscae]
MPYVARTSTHFNTTMSFYQTCSTQSANVQRIDNRNHSHILTPKSTAYSHTLLNPHLNGKYINLYQMPNNFATLTINSFQPNDTEAWVREAFTWIHVARLNNLTGLIIDISDATGDNTCLAYQLLNYLFPKEQNTLFSDTRHSPLTTLMGPPFDESKYLRPTHFYLLPNQTKPGPITHYRGKIHGQYSTLLVDNCSSHNQHYPGFNTISPVSWKKLSLLTNSACFESCAVFANILREVHSVRTYTHTLFPNSTPPSAIASMPSTNQVIISHIQDKLHQYPLLPISIAHALPPP